MGDLSSGKVLAAATLPATSAAGVFLIDGSHPVLVAGMIVVAVVSLVSTSAYLSRFLMNR